MCIVTTIYGVRKLLSETVNLADHKFTDACIAVLSFSSSDDKNKNNLKIILSLFRHNKTCNITWISFYDWSILIFIAEFALFTSSSTWKICGYWQVHGNPCASLYVNSIMVYNGAGRFLVALWDFLCMFRYGDTHRFPCSIHDDDDHGALHPVFNTIPKKWLNIST